jgi:hypothetical protein
MAYAGISATPVQAVTPDPCGLITQAKIAAAFGLVETVKHNTVVAAPGNPGGVVRNRCEAFAWRGRKPTNAKQKGEKLRNGTLARLSMQSWAPDEGPQAQAWRTRFDETLKRLRGASSDLFLKTLDGTRLIPPAFGAQDGVMFSAVSGGTHKVRGLWWNRNAKSLVVIDAVEAKGEPTVASLKHVAATVVGGFF